MTAGPWTKYQASQAPAETGPWTKYAPEPEVGQVEGIARSLGQGLSANWFDEYAASMKRRVAEEGIARTVAESAFPPVSLSRLAADVINRPEGYTQRLEEERRRSSAYEKENPKTALAASLAGGLATAVAPIGPAAQAVGRGVQGIGRVVRSGAVQGAIMGGISGLGGGGEDATASFAQDVGSRVASGVTGLGLGAGLGAVGGFVAGKIGQRVGQVKAAQAETATPRTAADNVLARTLERDRIDPQSMISQIREGIPRGAEQDARRSLSTADVETFMRMRRDGASTKEIATALGVSDKTIRARSDEIDRLAITPLSLVDYALLGGAGKGQNVLWKMKGAASTPGEARAAAHEAFTERQMGAGERITQAIRTHVASGDIDGSVAERVAAMRAAEKAAYQVASTAERPFDVGPALDRTIARFADRKGEVTDGVMKAVSLFERPVEIMSQDGAKVATKELRRIQGLRAFVDAKQELDQMIERSFVDRKPTQLTRELMQLKTGLMDEVSKSNPVWRAANDFFADGRAAERMLDLGQRSALRLNGGMREVLSEWQKLADTSSIRRSKLLTPDQAKDVVELRKELFREGLSRAIQDRVLNRQQVHDLTAELRTPAARKILTQVLGDQRAQAVFRVVDKEHAALRTHRSLFGSQTGGLIGEQADNGFAPRISSMWDLASPRKAFELAAERVGAHMTERQNSDLMRMLATMDPLDQLDILRRIQMMTSSRVQGREAFGPWGSAASASLVNPLVRTERPQRQNPLAVR